MSKFLHYSLAESQRSAQPAEDQPSDIKDEEETLAKVLSLMKILTKLVYRNPEILKIL